MLAVHLLGLGWPSIEAAELLQVVAAAGHVLELLVGEPRVHPHSTRRVALRPESTVRYEAGHPRLAEVRLLLGIRVELGVLLLVKEYVAVPLGCRMAVQYGRLRG